MKNKNNTLEYVLIAIAALLLVTGSAYAFSEIYNPKEITTENNQNNTNEPKGKVSGNDTTPLVKVIQTSFGELTLSYMNGKTTLSGSLTRPNPCTEWKVEVMSTKSLPPTHVNFNLDKVSTAEICIQVLGKPQEISVVTSAGPGTYYTVKTDGDIVDFAGKLE